MIYLSVFTVFALIKNHLWSKHLFKSQETSAAERKNISEQVWHYTAIFTYSHDLHTEAGWQPNPIACVPIWWYRHFLHTIFCWSQSWRLLLGWSCLVFTRLAQPWFTDIGPTKWGSWWVTVALWTRAIPHHTMPHHEKQCYNDILLLGFVPLASSIISSIFIISHNFLKMASKQGSQC